MKEQGVVRNFEAQTYRKDGSIIWISENARAVCDSRGQILYYEGMVEDITARKEAEEKLRFSEMRFRSIWQKSYEGMRLTDEQGIILAVNPAFCQIAGLRAEELVGHPYTALYAEGEDLAEMMQKYQQRFAARTVEPQLERHVTFRSGSTAEVELTNSFIETEEGRTLLLSLVRDVTVRKQAEERERKATAELARSQAELRKKNDILEEDLKMARDIQQAILPQQYPTFPPGASEETSLLHFCHRYHPSGQVGGRFFQRAGPLGHAGRLVYMRRDGAWRALGPGHGHGARAGGGTAAHRAGPRPIIDTDQFAICAPSCSKRARRSSPPPFIWWRTWSGASFFTPMPAIPSPSCSIVWPTRLKSSSMPTAKRGPPWVFLPTRHIRPSPARCRPGTW